ncbi:alpha/beta hydrolase [Microbispora amethystogenes]|uniref:alpha/beta fold hydrolase n=1 Tax=Microbispora amethystogenes TaxID=1427754 RepID=UPI0033ECDC7A
MSRRMYFDTSCGQIHARIGGTGGPHLLLLHESPLSSFVYEDMIAPLSAWARVIAPDTPGYGMSDPPPRRLTIPEYAEPMVEIIRGLDGPVLVVGSHTGASIAIEVARQAAGRVAGLALLGLATYTPEQRADRRRNWAPDQPPVEDGSHLTAAWERYNALWRGLDPAVRHQAVSAMLGSIERFNWAYHSAFEYEALPPLREVTCPVWATAAEGEFLEQATREAAAELGFAYEMIPGIPGQPSVRRPAELAAMLRRFADRVLPLPSASTAAPAGHGQPAAVPGAAPGAVSGAAHSGDGRTAG